MRTAPSLAPCSMKCFSGLTPFSRTSGRSASRTWRSHVSRPFSRLNAYRVAREWATSRGERKGMTMSGTMFISSSVGDQNGIMRQTRGSIRSAGPNSASRSGLTRALKSPATEDEYHRASMARQSSHVLPAEAGSSSLKSAILGLSITTHVVTGGWHECSRCRGAKLHPSPRIGPRFRYDACLGRGLLFP
jgi:hypothetical protein